MLRSIKYVSGVGGIEIELNSAIVVGNPSELFSREWSYTLGYRAVSGITRRAREVSFKAAFLDMGQADLLRRVCDRDVSKGQPGRIWVGDWFQRCYVTESATDAIMNDALTAKLSMVLLDGVWRREHAVEFWAAPDQGGEALDVPFDLPYDLGGAVPDETLAASDWAESPLGLVIYGPCYDPKITIGGNVYAIDGTVPDGARIEVDPLAFPRTVTLVNADGSNVDVFAQAHRGSGQGGGEYIFEPVQPGVSDVVWSKAFGFTAKWYDEEGEPAWC